MLFARKRSHFKNESLSINSGEISIESVTEMKYLGITLDKHLSFETHINKIINNVTQRTCILWKIRSYILESLAQYLYITLIHPLYQYCDFILDGCTATLQNRVKVSQNSALRAVKTCGPDYPTQKLHDDLMIDYLKTSQQKSTLKIVYRGVQDLGPDNLNNLFEIYQPTRSLRSESKNLLLPPVSRTKFSEADIAIRGCKYWNPLNDDYKTCETLEQFHISWYVHDFFCRILLNDIHPDF